MRKEKLNVRERTPLLWQHPQRTVPPTLVSSTPKPVGLTQNLQLWASLVAQWLRVCLPMQGTRVRALVWEDPTCRGATKPVSHNC